MTTALPPDPTDLESEVEKLKQAFSTSSHSESLLAVLPFLEAMERRDALALVALTQGQTRDDLVVDVVHLSLAAVSLVHQLVADAPFDAGEFLAHLRAEATARVAGR